MYLNDLNNLPELVKTSNFTIIVADPEKSLNILQKSYKTSLSLLSPDEKTGKIAIESVRNLLAQTESKEKSSRFFVVKHAEALNTASENAILKSLEEPKENHYFIFLTDSPSRLLPTILSRANLYFEKKINPLDAPLSCDESLKDDAKKLISADTKSLIIFASELAKKKDNARLYTEKVVAAAIEILYKSYFLTNQEKFLKKLPGLLRLYENLEKNGNIKLQIVANML